MDKIFCHGICNSISIHWLPFTPTSNLGASSSPKLQVFGLWDETHRYTERTGYRKASAGFEPRTFLLHSERALITQTLLHTDVKIKKLS